MTPQQHEAAKQLFLEASGLPGDQWDQFLQQQQDRGTDSLVLEEVRSLLRHHSSQTLIVEERSRPTEANLRAETDRLSAGQSGPNVLSRAQSTTGAAARVPSQHASANRSVPAAAETVAMPVPAGKRTAPQVIRELGGTLSRNWLTRLGPAGQLALGTALASLLLGLVGYGISQFRDRASREVRASALTSALNVTVRALELWIEQEETQVETAARDPSLRDHIEELTKLADQGADAMGLRAAPAQAQIREQLMESVGDEVRYAVWDRQYRTVADWSIEGAGLGQGVTPYGASVLARVLDGETVTQLPGSHPPITKDYRVDPAGPKIGVVAPIYSADEKVIGAILVYNLGADDRFRDILSIVQIGKTGETYAFDKSAVMISDSRFTDELERAGLLELDPTTHALKDRIELRDPGQSLVAAGLPPAPKETWPRTKMARFAIAGQDGIDLDGYRNYRGVDVVGAWKWMPEHGMGVATEIEMREFRNQLYAIQLDQAVMLGLLGVSLAGVLGSYYSLSRLRRRMSESRRLGQYVLEDKLGEGGMGVVYRAHHDLLKRPTAIKLLKSDQVNARNSSWFEQEAQLASQLTHPNTITIYDYGVSEDGACYYVMEFLDGVNLEELVWNEGPLTVERTVRLWRQAASSLREAHELGLVHRDIKPHNLMICKRGGEADFLKVLDFGLVKQFDQLGDSHGSTVLAGTPMYMAPERLTTRGQSGPRVDIYALGAVAFFLLTGRDIFDMNSPDALLEQVLHAVPPRVSTLSQQPIPEALDRLIEACLAKQPQDRPESMQEVLEALDALA